MPKFHNEHCLLCSDITFLRKKMYHTKLEVFRNLTFALMKCCLLIKPSRVFVFFSFLNTLFYLFPVLQNLHVGNFSHYNGPPGFPGIPFRQFSALLVGGGQCGTLSQLRGCCTWRTGECEEGV